MSLNKVIALRGEPIVDEQLTASAAITPGDLIEISSGQWQRHGSAGLNAAAVFALERDEGGVGIATDSTDDYAVNDYVKAGFFKPGERVNALIASGQNLSQGAFLESAGDGTLRALTTDAATDDTQRVSVVAMSAEDSGAVLVKTRHAVIIV
jgi:hypothetical protein